MGHRYPLQRGFPALSLHQLSARAREAGSRGVWLLVLALVSP